MRRQLLHLDEAPCFLQGHHTNLLSPKLFILRFYIFIIDIVQHTFSPSALPVRGWTLLAVFYSELSGSTAMRYTDSSTLILEFSTVLSAPTDSNLLYKDFGISIVNLLNAHFSGNFRFNVFQVLPEIIFLIVMCPTLNSQKISLILKPYSRRVGIISTCSLVRVETFSTCFV